MFSKIKTKSMERGNPALRKEIHEMVGLPPRKENHFFSRKATKQHWVKAKYNTVRNTQLKPCCKNTCTLYIILCM